ncbi:divalent metal cation transporter [Parahaliea aestuarii]|uniref:Divalent metal cation transporter n=1 Tax=Parahaliea aestuarii TaxID=1852021 RepID=A0A5C8ZQD6_9GAMM|nr:divalent metal cation transporter [Parahaliea aestuarii]TXS90555.1 divalent metal cation transporter [Parahaliea aestuarii]
MSEQTLEIQTLQQLAQRPALARLPAYLRLSGPGWLQGAMTLGGGSAITSLTIGAMYGYELLWVQPLSMLIGCIMLFALSHQTLSSGQRPYEAMRRYVSPSLAWLWAVAALASSIIWGFSHYPLSAGMLEDIVSVASGFRPEDGPGRELYLFLLAVAVWALCAFTAWNYGAGGRPVKVFETAIKLLSTMIVLAFTWVVASASLSGQVDWSAVLAGFVPSSLPTDAAGVTTVMAALGTAVGINMTFVYGYTLLERGWQREHRELARYDIVIGLVLPYILVTSLMAIAAAGAFHGSGLDIRGKLAPAQAASMFVDAGLNPVTGRLIFAFGVLGMAVGSLVMHMLCCGAAAAALFGWAPHSRRYRLALLLPTPAVLGVFLWSTLGAYLVLPTSAICGFLLPIAYFGWLLLNNREDYLGPDRPRGGRALLYNGAMLLCIVTVLASVCYSTAVALALI